MWSLSFQRSIFLPNLDKYLCVELLVSSLRFTGVETVVPNDISVR